MRIEPIHLWRWIGTESEPNSLFIHRITIKSRTVTPPRTATLSKLSRLGHHTRCIRRPRYKLWWPIMLGHYWLDAVEKETAYQVVLCSSLKFMFHVVYYQWQGKVIIGRTLVCVSIHLECWLDKPKGRNRYLGCSGCGKPTAIRLQFSFKILAVWMRSMWIQFAFDAHWVNVKCEFAFKPNQVWKGL